VVALFQGRSEFGPRALGSRSLLADPRKSEMIAFINEDIKLREDFRPFAPSVIFSEAQNWFEDVTPSPYMSITAMVSSAATGGAAVLTAATKSYSRLSTSFALCR
jgi:carbamoyltransferase